MDAALKLDRLPLRARKAARTRLTLMQETLRQLREKPFAQISIKSLCRAVPISEATFFNYFARKVDLLFYFTRVWSLEAVYHARAVTGEKSGLEMIERVFQHAGERVAAHPRVMLEITSALALEGEPPFEPVSAAERLLAFPSLVGITELEPLRLTDVFAHYLQQAIVAGELPASTRTETAIIGLTNIFFGVPMFYQLTHASNVPQMYKMQLGLLWGGLRAVAG